MRNVIRVAGVLLVALALLAPSTMQSAPARAAGSVGTEYYAVSGVGSTWSANALQQWIRNVWNNRRWKIEYSDQGSSAGRQLFGQPNGGYDFAVSEIPYALANSDSVDPRPARKFAYMPIVAGGTSFMYNLVIGGKKVTDLRLGGETVAMIFTGAITRWDDPAIKAHNPHLALPAIPIVPVVRSDGSGTSAQFSSWIRKQYPQIWNDFCLRAGRQANCGITSNYPAITGFKGQSGSNGVAGYVAQPQYVGSITYVEYSYALNSRSPVANILNAAGQYVGPTAANVAVALLAAKINTDQSSPDYLTQQLDDVYTNPDPRSYPLSSYSYMIIPTALEYGLTENKGLTLAAFANYFLCEGQQYAEVLGYSPLPINLVQAGLEQVSRIPGGDPATSQCRAGAGGAVDPSGAGSAPGAGGEDLGVSESTGGNDIETLDGSGGSAIVAGSPQKLPVSSDYVPGLIAMSAVVLVVLIGVFGPPLTSAVRSLRTPASARRPTLKTVIPRIHLPSWGRKRSPGPSPSAGS